MFSITGGTRLLGKPNFVGGSKISFPLSWRCSDSFLGGWDTSIMIWMAWRCRDLNFFYPCAFLNSIITVFWWWCQHECRLMVGVDTIRWSKTTQSTKKDEETVFFFLYFSFRWMTWRTSYYQKYVIVNSLNYVEILEKMKRVGDHCSYNPRNISALFFSASEKPFSSFHIKHIIL